MSQLQHKIPDFTPVDFGPDGVAEALIMKEVKLPFAKQTHEVCYEPHTKTLWVTQLSNSTLVRIKTDEKGILKDEKMEAWTVGPVGGHLHNASPSYSDPGCLWLSLQSRNTLLLVDVKPGDNFLSVKEIYQVPTVINADGKANHVGTPHCIRECKLTGNIWAMLKGALDDDHNPCAKLSPCCCPKTLKKAMEANAADPDLDINIPDGYGVWQLDRKKYNPSCPTGAKGGKTFKCLKSPPMAALDDKGNCWCAQDQSDTLIFIDGKSGATEFIQVPWPEGTPDSAKHTGPGIAKCPDGSIWITELETMSSLVRIDTDTHVPVLYQFVPPAWARGIRFIHLDFHAAINPEHHNRLYAISSTLLQDESTDALFIINMCPGWKKVEGVRIVPLPSQQSACHRVTYCEIDDGDDECDDGSVFITEMSKAKLLQVKVNQDVHMTVVDEEISTDAQGFEVRKYVMTEEIEFGLKNLVCEEDN